jgi:hypothetical protein
LECQGFLVEYYHRVYPQWASTLFAPIFSHSLPAPPSGLQSPSARIIARVEYLLTRSLDSTPT